MPSDLEALEKMSPEVADRVFHGGQGPNVIQTPAPAEPAPAAVTEPPPTTPPAATAPQPAPSTPPPPATPTPEPGKTPSGQDPAPATPAAPTAQSEPVPAATPDSDYEEVTLEDLGYQSMTDLRNDLARIEQLEKDLGEAKKQPFFKSEKARVMFDMANAHEEEGWAATLDKMRVLSLDPAKMADHQTRYEAFRLEASNQGLSEGQIQELFAAEELERYGDPNNTEVPQTNVQKIRAQQATEAAKRKLSDLQKQYGTAKAAADMPQQPAYDIEAVRSTVQKQLQAFDGLNLTLQGKDEDGKNVEGKLNFKLDQAQLAELKADLADMAGWWDKQLLQSGFFKEGSAETDFSKLAPIVATVKYHQRLVNDAYYQGRQDQLADSVKRHRNSQTPAQVATPPQQPENKAPLDERIAEEAWKAAGVK